MIKVMQEQLTERLLMLWRLTEDGDGDAIYKEAADRIAALEQAIKAAYALGHKHALLPQGSKELLLTDNQILANVLKLEGVTYE